MTRPAASVRIGSLDDALKYAEFLEAERDRLATALSLAQTEIKGHMRVKDDLEAEVIMLNGIIRVRTDALAQAQARIAASAVKEYDKERARPNDR